MAALRDDLKTVSRAVEGWIHTKLASMVDSLDALGRGLEEQVRLHNQDMQGVRAKLENIDRHFEEYIAANEGLMEKDDFLITMMMAVRRESIDTPRRACILPPVASLMTSKIRRAGSHGCASGKPVASSGGKGCSK